MNPAQTERGLDPAQLELLRDALSAGRSPRVRLIGSSSAGGSGVVTRVGDPASDGPEFITVRVKVGGRADEIPFAPTELATGRAPVRESEPPPAVTAAARPRRTRAKPPTDPAPAPPAVQADSTAPPEPTLNPEPEPKPKPKSKATVRRRTETPASVSMTMSSTGSSWILNATRGARSIVKSAPVAAGVVTAVAELLGAPELRAAVGAINDKARLEAEERATELRAELAEVEALLAAQRAPH